MGVFEARKLHKTDGAWSTGAWLRSHTDLGRREANSLERHARMVRTRPLLGMALDTLGATKLRTMLRYVTFRLGDAYAEAEPVLLEQVAKLDTDQTVVLLRGWAQRVDQDGREPKSWDDNELDLHHTYQGGCTPGGGCRPRVRRRTGRRVGRRSRSDLPGRGHRRPSASPWAGGGPWR